MIAGVRELIRYRELVLNLVRRDVKRRYKGSILGFLWYLVNPLMIFGTLWLIFRHFFERFAGLEAYAVYLLSALVAWTFFSQSVLGAATNLAGSGGLIRKVYFPKAVFPLSSVGGGFVNFVLSLVPLCIVILIERRPVGWTLLFLPVGILILVTFSTGLALLISSLNVFFRDVQHIAEVVFLAWFYATPIIWPVEALPPGLRPLCEWNPMTAIVECFRAPVYAGSLPATQSIVWATVSAAAALLLGALVFRRLESRFIYHL